MLIIKFEFEKFQYLVINHCTMTIIHWQKYDCSCSNFSLIYHLFDKQSWMIWLYKLYVQIVQCNSMKESLKVMHFIAVIFTCD